MADEGVTFVEDDLHAVRPSALIATRHETDIFSAGAGRGRGHVDQTIKLPI
jgi:hypothetical protein